MNLPKDAIQALLRRGIVEVKFNKADGTPRTLHATLHPDMLPEKPAPSPSAPAKAPRAESPDKVNCWDVDAGAWRSFNISTLSEEPVLVRPIEPQS